MRICETEAIRVIGLYLDQPKWSFSDLYVLEYISKPIDDYLLSNKIDVGRSYKLKS